MGAPSAPPSTAAPSSESASPPPMLSTCDSSAVAGFTTAQASKRAITATDSLWIGVAGARIASAPSGDVVKIPTAEEAQQQCLAKRLTRNKEGIRHSRQKARMPTIEFEKATRALNPTRSLERQMPSLLRVAV